MTFDCMVISYTYWYQKQASLFAFLFFITLTNNGVFSQKAIYSIRGVFCAKSLFDRKGLISRNRPKCKTAELGNKCFYDKSDL